MRIRANDLVILFSRLAIGSVLLYAGFMKAVGPSAEFAAVLETYKLFPPSLLTPLAIGLPYVEMWTGLFLLAGLYSRQAALLSTLLFASFLTVISAAFLRGIDLSSCGCFGSDILSPRYTFILDVGLLVLSLTTFRLTKLPPPLSLDRAFPKV